MVLEEVKLECVLVGLEKERAEGERIGIERE